MRGLKVRLPGGGGAPEIAVHSQQIYLTMKQSLRGFVPKIDFFTSMGFGQGGNQRTDMGVMTKGPTKLMTDMAIWEPHPHQRIARHQPAPRDHARCYGRSVGWEILYADHVAETPAPTDEELGVLRDLHARTKAAHQGR